MFASYKDCRCPPSLQTLICTVNPSWKWQIYLQSICERVGVLKCPRWSRCAPGSGALFSPVLSFFWFWNLQLHLSHLIKSYPLVIQQFASEHGHWARWFTMILPIDLFKMAGFHSFLYVYQRVTSVSGNYKNWEDTLPQLSYVILWFVPSATPYTVRGASFRSMVDDRFWRLSRDLDGSFLLLLARLGMTWDGQEISNWSRQ